jgi:hypothetical protein
MRGPSGPQARTVRTADRPASGPDRPLAQFGTQHKPLLRSGREMKCMVWSTANQGTDDATRSQAKSSQIGKDNNERYMHHSTNVLWEPKRRPTHIIVIALLQSGMLMSEPGAGRSVTAKGVDR